MKENGGREVGKIKFIYLFGEKGGGLSVYNTFGKSLWEIQN
jgi:hypothetical protein